jgi:hypothetical protein
MKTIIAYILVFFLGPIFASLTHVIILPINVFIIRRGIPQFPVSLLTGLINGVAAVWFGTIILNWFSLPPTIWLLITLGLGYLMNGANRLKTRENTDSEIGYLVGDIIGIVFSGLVLVWTFEITQLTIPFFIIIGVIGLIAFTMTGKGNLSFWKIANRYPEEAYNFFLNNDTWHVIDNINNVDPPTKDENWDGPFRLFIPSINRTVKIYGKTDSYFESQEDFKNYIDHRTS